MSHGGLSGEGCLSLDLWQCSSVIVHFHPDPDQAILPIDTIEEKQSVASLTSSTHLGGLVEMWLSKKMSCSCKGWLTGRKEVRDQSQSRKLQSNGGFHFALVYGAKTLAGLVHVTQRIGKGPLYQLLLDPCSST